jgi:pyruvoyl-dependent arginine decarboxylase (PvlArgDC)
MQIARARFWEEAGVMDKREKEREIKRGATCGGVAWGGRKMCDRPGRQVAGAVGAVVGTWFWFNERRKKGTEAKQAKKTNEQTSARRLVRTFWFHKDNKKEGEVSAKSKAQEKAHSHRQAHALTVTGDEISMTSISCDHDLAVGVLGF